MIKSNTGFSEYTDDGLQHLGENVAAKLPTIPVFATLKPTPADITAAVTALVDARKMTGPRSDQAVNAAFNALALLLGEVATRATEPPPAPGNLRLAHGAMQGRDHRQVRPGAEQHPHLRSAMGA